jgi:hypothetical protein
VQGDIQTGGLTGSSSVESQMHIQHFLTPRVDERGGMDGRGVACSEVELVGACVEEELLSNTVSESSEVIEGEDEVVGSLSLDRDAVPDEACTSS